MRQSLADFNESFIYRNHDSFDSVYQALTSLLNNTNEIIHVAAVMTNEDLIDKRLPFLSTTQLEESHRTDIARFLRLEKNIGDKEIKGAALIVKPGYEGVYLVVSLDKTRVFEQFILPSILKFSPTRITSFGISTRKIISYINGLNSLLGENEFLHVTHLNTKNRLGYHDPSRKKYESDLRWTDKTIAEIAVEIDPELIGIKRIIVEGISPLSKKHMKCSLSNISTVSYVGDFEILFESIIRPLLIEASQRFVTVNRRERLRAEDYKPKPLVLDLEKPVLSDTEGVYRLINTLRGLPRCSLSVVHSNPYARLSYVDLRDGSSFEIWVLDGSRITIVPQMRATVTSIERLSHHIFEEFEEGTIKDLVNS